MSLKQEIETWVTALARYDNNEFDQALKSFESIADTSKILFNCGVIHATLGEHEKAVQFYLQAIKLDQYLAVAYFQQGVSNFLMGDFEEALANFNDTLLYLRGNNNIDYEQLGLKFKLYSCEVLFNRGLCYIYLQQTDAGMQDLSFAAKEKVVPDHDVIDEAIREQAEGYTVFSIPVGIVYRPNEAKVKNLKTKDYLGKARLVAATDRNNAFTGFAGAEIKKMNDPGNAKDDRPDDKISYAATNLVKPGISSRARQQSEPPLQRNVFPPTPPPENDKPSPDKRPTGGMSRAESVRGGGPKPRPLDLSVAGFDQSSDRPRIGTQRSMSERPRPSQPQRNESQSNGYGRSRDSAGSGGARRSGASSNGGGRRAPPPRRVEEFDDDGYPDDVYDMYSERNSRASGGRGRGQNSRMRDTYIEEEEEDDYDDVDDAEFEMMNTRRSRRSSPPPAQQQQQRASSRRPAPERESVRKIRVKVHAEDTRYVMIGTAVEFRDFVDQIRIKFGLRTNFKVKIRDDEDMITMSDQDDLDMAIQASKAGARRERSDMGKMEVWIQEV
ncbi:hypothetical protein K402DRAFT_423521 [Aulographum hederae CBS 113979]|uniref:PB1 domain-containing protein n=1 Tax=Aulographum hederae CBS 113979 TaxID=1176131 RepID=A0A6G1GRT6_9PEZI|nr:hypothetical protein K402DRAFT_423521 [Aulographum hederae CBS 113979]